jgi:hypothetical protein
MLAKINHRKIKISIKIMPHPDLISLPKSRNWQINSIPILKGHFMS